MESKSDAELIEEAEKLLTLPSTDLAKELASRLKTANAKLKKAEFFIEAQDDD